MPHPTNRLYRVTSKNSLDRNVFKEVAEKAAEKAHEKAIEQFRKKTAAKRIGRFMHRTTHKRKAEFLKSICSDAGVCIAFGTFADKIKKHFNGFTDFTYAKAPITRIGSSANGFITQITYENHGYQAHAVLKSSLEEDADNLWYEYMVGNYINKQNNFFPCFLETYGLYMYIYEEAWHHMRSKKNISDMRVLTNYIKLLNRPNSTSSSSRSRSSSRSLLKVQKYDHICKFSKYLAVLIQHLKGIESVCDKLIDPDFIKQDLLYVLFQVYVPLGLLKDDYTHYDLHAQNVALYTPVKGKYIEYHYHLSGGREIVFKSQYIAKIIDYGRCYFNDKKSGINSREIYQEICAEPKCNKHVTPIKSSPIKSSPIKSSPIKSSPNKCGVDNGFGWLYEPIDDAEIAANFWICSQKRNMSHDLRLLHYINITENGLPYMRPVVYNHVFGTPELIDTGLNGGMDEKIHNVQDAADHFISEVTKPEAIMANNAFYQSLGFTSLGKLHIYCDDTNTSMEFKQ